MGKKYENDFKVMIVELLKSGRTAKEISDEYTINDGIIRRWKREYESKSGDFSKKREVSFQEQELKLCNYSVSNSKKHFFQIDCL